jgi:hypothetical protein
MNIQYNTLFSINLRHNYYANGLCPDFDIVPTAECQAFMRRFELGAKLLGGVLLVYFEESVATGKPRVKVEDWLPFRFVMQLKQSAFYNYTVLPKATKPFFFSNLDENGVEKVPNTEGSFLSKNATPDLADLIDIKSNAFSVQHPLGTTQIKLSLFRPQTGFELVKTMEARPLTTTTAVSLPTFQNGLVKVENNSDGTPQYFYADAAISGSKPFGIIEIWRNPTRLYTPPQVFNLKWERKKDFWRYFIIKREAETDFSIKIENVKAAEYPSARFDVINEADQTAKEKQIISNYTDAAIDLFRSSVELPQFERPFGKINLSDTMGRIDILLPQPTFRSTDTNIIVKIQKKVEHG